MSLPNLSDSGSHLVAFRKMLSSSFNEQELNTLCFDLGVDYEDLPGQTKTEKVVELIKLLFRLGRWDDLINYCNQARPNQKWPVIREKALAEIGQLYLTDPSFVPSQRRKALPGFLLFLGVLLGVLMIGIIVLNSLKEAGSIAIEPISTTTKFSTPITNSSDTPSPLATDTLDLTVTTLSSVNKENECRTLMDDLQSAFRATDVVEIAYTKVNLRETAVYSLMNANNAYMNKINSANVFEARFDTVFENQVNDPRRDDTTFRIQDNGDDFEVQIIWHSWGETLVQSHDIQCFTTGRNRKCRGSKGLMAALSGPGRSYSSFLW